MLVSKPYSISILEPLYNTIQSKSHSEVRWYIAGKAKDIQVNGDQLNTTKEVMEFNPDAVIVPGNVVPHYWPGLKVQVFHGLGEEKRGHYRITGFFDLYCTPGPYMTERFNKLAKKKRYFIVSQTGWPKLDLLSQKIDQRQLKREIGFNSDKPLILYAPTFSPKYTSALKLLPEISKMRNDGWQWIIKFHSLMDPSIIEMYKQVENQSVKISSSEDIIPLMQAADILVTDTSSAAYEYLLLDRPVISYCAAVRMDKGIDLQSPSELKNAVRRSLDNPEEFSRVRQKYVKELHPYFDGKSSERVLSAIENVIHNRLYQNLRRKPINLFEKWKIRRMFDKWE